MSQRPRLAGDGRLLLPDDVQFDAERGAYLLHFGDQLVDPFGSTADRLLLTESFVRLDLADRGASQEWFRRHGAVDQGTLRGLVLGASGEHNAERPRWHSEDEEVLLLDERDRVAWLLLTLARLSHLQPSKAWDPTFGQVILVGAGEGLIVGGPYAGRRVWPDLGWQRYPEAHRAQPPTSEEVEEQTKLIAATKGWPVVSVIDYRWRNVQLAPNDRTTGSLVSEIEGRADTLGTTWEEAVQLVRLILEPYLQHAAESLFTTEVVTQKTKEGQREIVVPHEERVWRSILAPIHLQLFESLRRITEGEPGGAFCRVCRRPFLVLDARRRFFCNDRERYRHAQRERRRRLRTDEESE